MASIGGMGNLLKQAQEMQARMAKIQEELGQKTVQGSAGGGMGAGVGFAGSVPGATSPAGSTRTR